MLLDPVYVGERRHRVARTKRVDEIGIHELLVKNLGQDKRGGGRTKHVVAGTEDGYRFCLVALRTRANLGRTAPPVAQTKASDALVQVRERAESIGKVTVKIRVASAPLEHCYGVRSESKHTVVVFAHLVEISSRERSGESEDEPGGHGEPILAVLNGVKVSRVCESS